MNIEVVGRIRPSIRAEGPESLVIQGQSIAAKTGGLFARYKYFDLVKVNNIVILRERAIDHRYRHFYPVKYLYMCSKRGKYDCV